MKSLKIKFIRLTSTALMLMLVLPAMLVAQNDVPTGNYPNLTDAKGQKQGAWKKLDSAGTCIYVGQFKDDKPQGLFTYFDTDGRKMTEMDFLKGGPVNYSKMFSIKGKLQAQGKYLNQLKDSVWTFYTEEGLFLCEENYVKGKKQGKSITYYPGTKQIAEVKYFKNGLQDSAWTQYYRDGKKEAEGTYKMGNYEGKAVWYFPDGKIKIIGNYLHSLKDGIWVYYWINAKGVYEVKGKETWKGGKLTSPAILITKDEFNQQIEDQNDPNKGGDPGGQ